MEKMSIHDTDDAVTSVTALREVLSAELTAIERLVQKVDHSSAKNNAGQPDDLIETYRRVRTSLLSGLASVDEVLGWVRVLAPKDADGNEMDSVRSLPRVRNMHSKS
ncbi:MAG: hypothetical protein V7642_4828 [Burkholderiales bacterium]|jgi:hypothetical protein